MRIGNLLGYSLLSLMVGCTTMPKRKGWRDTVSEEEFSWMHYQFVKKKFSEAVTKAMHLNVHTGMQ